MEKENQVVNIKLAKLMDELGFKQDSVFYWNPPVTTEFDGSNEEYQEGQPYTLDNINKGFAYFKSYPAYTVAELWNMLPALISIKKRVRYHEYFLRIDKFTLGHKISYENDKDFLWATVAQNIVDSMSEMLIYLKENKLI